MQAKRQRRFLFAKWRSVVRETAVYLGLSLLREYRTGDYGGTETRLESEKHERPLCAIVYLCYLVILSADPDAYTHPDAKQTAVYSHDETQWQAGVRLCLPTPGLKTAVFRV